MPQQRITRIKGKTFRPSANSTFAFIWTHGRSRCRRKPDVVKGSFTSANRRVNLPVSWQKLHDSWLRDKSFIFYMAQQASKFHAPISSLSLPSSSHVGVTQGAEGWVRTFRGLASHGKDPTFRELQSVTKDYKPCSQASPKMEASAVLRPTSNTPASAASPASAPSLLSKAARSTVLER